MMGAQKLETVFPSKASKYGAVVKGGLRVELEFGSPPGFGDCTGLHIDRVFCLMGQMGPPIFHPGNARIPIMRIHPRPVAPCRKLT